MSAGKLVVISAPSGGGKNAIMRSLIQRFDNAAQLVTTTTRAPRPGERDGIDYHFVSKEVFLEKLEKGAFVEHNVYVDNYYGTEWEVMNNALASYNVVFSQVEVTGKQNFDKAGVKHISIFLLPDDIAILDTRLHKRGGMKEEDIEARLAIARQEIDISHIYDFRVVNGEGRLAETIHQITEYLGGIHHLPLLDKTAAI